VPVAQTRRAAGLGGRRPRRSDPRLSGCWESRVHRRDLAGILATIPHPAAGGIEDVRKPSSSSRCRSRSPGRIQARSRSTRRLQAARRGGRAQRVRQHLAALREQARTIDSNGAVGHRHLRRPEVQRMTRDHTSGAAGTRPAASEQRLDVRVDLHQDRRPRTDATLRRRHPLGDLPLQHQRGVAQPAGRRRQLEQAEQDGRRYL